MAAAIEFLAADAAAMITGHVFGADGGWHVREAKRVSENLPNLN
jgi:NAD(P)-dependent dehydrogenase (short-subunit alcohol dehydrogenase family)